MDGRGETKKKSPHFENSQPRSKTEPNHSCNHKTDPHEPFPDKPRPKLLLRRKPTISPQLRAEEIESIDAEDTTACQAG